MRGIARLVVVVLTVLGLSGCALSVSASEAASTANPSAQDHDAAYASDHDRYLAEAVRYGWSADSEPLLALMAYVEACVDENSDTYVAPQDRIAVFDHDGTLYGERFPTYFNDWLYIQRALYDDTYEAPEELRAFAQRWEDKVLRGVPIEDFDPLERLYGPQLYEGLTYPEYAEVVRRFKATDVWGFEGMTYGDAYFQPMVFVVKYLYENGFEIYVCTATYRDAVRIMLEGELDQYIPADHVIGTDLLYETTGQGDEASLDHKMSVDEDLVIAGELFVKNSNTNKALAMQREIGKYPLLAFGNSSGDFSMANYVLQNPDHPTMAFMLLCDNTEHDYGDPEVAAAFAEKCEAAGYMTVSMAGDWSTIYGEGVHLAPVEEGLAEAA